MRVLVLATDHPPDRAGGYELQCAAAVAHLRRHGHEVRVLTSGRRAGPAPESSVVRDLPLARAPAAHPAAPRVGGRAPWRPPTAPPDALLCPAR